MQISWKQKIFADGSKFIFTFFAIFFLINCNLIIFSRTCKHDICFFGFLNPYQGFWSRKKFTSWLNPYCKRLQWNTFCRISFSATNVEFLRMCITLLIFVVQLHDGVGDEWGGFPFRYRRDNFKYIYTYQDKYIQQHNFVKVIFY